MKRWNIVRYFTMFIKPQYLPRMHKHVRELTGITSRELYHGVPFKTAMQHFQNWCGNEYMLLSWGSDDILILRENLMLHKMKALSYDEWVDAQMIMPINDMVQISNILWHMLWRISIYRQSICLLITHCMMLYLRLIYVKS